MENEIGVKMIIRNAAKCKKCGEVIESRYLHDFKYCRCGEIFVDGGFDYIRRGGKNLSNIEDLSIVDSTDEGQDPCCG